MAGVNVTAEHRNTSRKTQNAHSNTTSVWHIVTLPQYGTCNTTSVWHIVKLTQYATTSWLLTQFFQVISYYICNSCSIHFICFDDIEFELVLFRLFFKFYSHVDDNILAQRTAPSNKVAANTTTFGTRIATGCVTQIDNLISSSGRRRRDGLSKWSIQFNRCTLIVCK